jgi:predicted ABC-type ATPase
MGVAEAAARYAEAARRVVIVAGPNGAGKTTFAREFLPREGSLARFVNADEIAAGLSPFAPEAAAIRAGRLMVRAIREYATAGVSFAIETTLAGRRYAGAIPRWQAGGYGVKLVFLRLPDVETALARVAARVVMGGHGVPEAAVRRRFAEGWRLFNSVYRPMVDAWAVHDSSGSVPRLTEEGENE